ncbi:hypothetical protein MTO96_010508 [Rhipicephalus appendiculatus]
MRTSRGGVSVRTREAWKNGAAIAACISLSAAGMPTARALSPHSVFEMSGMPTDDGRTGNAGTVNPACIVMESARPPHVPHLQASYLHRRGEGSTFVDPSELEAIGPSTLVSL